MLRLAATSAMAVAFMAQAALAQGSNSGSGSGDKFSQCLCYNQNSKSFCHGNDWYNSQACQDWFFANYNWVFIVLILVFVMLAFPFIFCCSRFCCQCCGGRHATRGCCCSDTSTQAIFPGYTNRSIACTRIAFITSCALAATLTIVTFAHNTKFHNAANESISVFQQGAQQLAQYGNAVNQMAIYAQTPVNYFTAVNLAISPVNLDAVQTVSSTLQTVHDAENNNGYGRSHLTQMISCWALIVPVLAFIPMACSWKSSMNVFLIVQCFIATVLLIAIAPTAVFSEALTEACNHWDSTTAPFIQGALASAGVPSTMQQADSINMAINNILGGSGATSGSSGSAATGSGSNMGGTNFCADVQSVCAAIGGCMATPCANSVTMGCNGAQAPTFATFYNSFTSFNQQMTQFLNSACQGGNSINMAAANNQQAQSIVSFANAISGFQHVTQGDYVYQGWVSTMLTSAEMPLCVSLRVHAKNVAVSIGVQYLVALLIMISVFLGIKRFAKWNSYNPYAEYMGLTTEAPVITAIVVEINSDAPWSPSPAAGYGMVSPVAGTYVEAC